MKLEGSYVALITPFDENRNVNYNQLRKLILWHLDQKTDGFVVLGTTSEDVTLSSEEEVKIIELTLATVNKKIPVIAGCGSNDTSKALKKAVQFEQLGVDGLLVVTPYYNKTNKKGMYLHFRKIADAVKVPIILYNVPSRTGCSISIDVISRLSKHQNIIGIKEASGNISYAIDVAEFANEHFIMMSGNDDLCIPMLSIGAKGVISVAANIIPYRMHEMVNCCLNGELDRALQMQKFYLPLLRALFLEVNPIPIKAAMNMLGYNVGGYRLPLYGMERGKKKLLIHALRQCNLI